MKWLGPPVLAIILFAGTAAAHPAEKGRADLSVLRDAAASEVGGQEEPPPPTVGQQIARIPRFLLWAPRWILEGPFHAIRYGMRLQEKYHITDRIKAVFLTEDERAGLFPTAFFETGFGTNVGARGFHKDLLGPGRSVRGRAGFGGQENQVYELSARDPGSLGVGITTRLDGSYRILGNEYLFSPGAESRSDSEGRYREERTTGGLRFELPSLKSPHVRTSPRSDLRFRKSNASDVRFPPPTAPPAGIGLRDVTWLTPEGGVNLHVDTLGPALRDFHMEAFGGYTEGLGNDPSRFTYFGATASFFVPVYGPRRRIGLRAAVEEARRLGEQPLPLLALPALGGKSDLRGYAAGRFRDRAMGLATLEYRYPIWAYWDAAVFVDAGRVMPGLGSFSFEHVRYGYGGEVHLGTRRGFALRMQAAASEEDVRFQVAFDQAFHGFQFRRVP